MTERILIGELAEAAGVNPRTIRYYEDIGLLPSPPRTEAGYRLYGVEDRTRLEFILRARQLDFSLEEIGEILAFREAGDVPCPFVVQRMGSKIEQVERRIADLEQLRHELVELREEARALPPEELARRGRICHLIENRTLEAPQG